MRRSAAEGGGRPVRILFLAWGYSIHAERRMRIFAEDPGFEVAIVSPHGYRLTGARTVLLLGEAERGEISSRYVRERGGSPVGEAPSFSWFRRRLDQARDLSRVAPFLGRVGLADPRALRSVLNSLNLLIEMEIGRRDLAILSKAVREFRPEVVFLQTLLYPCYLAFGLPKSIPLMITFWNGDLTWKAQGSENKRLLKERILEHGVRRARALTVNSEAARSACLSYGISPETVHLVRYPGVDLRRFFPSSVREAKEKLSIEARRVVLCPRGLGGYLNSDVIVDAMPEVLRRHPDTIFLFLSEVGADEWERHAERARGLGVERHLRRDGGIPWERMPEYYNASDVMVSVSSNDSLPNCMLEAMACGIPVVLGDIPAIREWITDGINGFLVPPRDPSALAAKILEVFEAPEARIGEFSRYNRDVVEREANGDKAAEEVKRLVRLHAGRQ